MTQVLLEIKNEQPLNHIASQKSLMARLQCRRLLRTVYHKAQSQPSDCLAAGAVRALDYIAVPARYDECLELLQIGEYGATYEKLCHLEAGRRLNFYLGMSRVITLLW